MSTRITLARVLSSGIKTSTDHRVSNLARSIGISTVIITDNRYINLLKYSGKAATLRGGPPSSNGTHGSCSIFFILGRKANGSNMRSHGSRRFQLQKTDIILNIPIIIAFVHNNLGNLNILLGSSHNPIRTD